MKILEALRNAASRVQSHVTDSNLFGHMGNRGTRRERIVEEFVRPFLAPCYGLASGEVFDSVGNGSRQVDVLVFDAAFSAPLLLDKKTNLGVFPCESVYAAIEVKSDLSSDEIQTAVDNIASVKCLKRVPSDASQILPRVRLKLGDGLSAGTGVLNPYLGAVFGDKGATANTALKKLQAQTMEKDLLPDFLVCNDPGYMILRLRTDGRPSPPGGKWTGYGIIHTGPDTLPLFFLSLNVCLRQIRLREPDWNHYWIELTKSLVANSGTTPSNDLTPTQNT